MIPSHDTIAAISTPSGRAGIGIIRVSGPMAEIIGEKLFVPRNFSWPLQSHRLYLGDLIDPSSETVIDEVLLSFMKAPNTYTRQDIVEINSHSGFVLLSRILQLILNCGARIAVPGEFTLRAFLNGRIDLTQAEAVMDLINSRSEVGLLMASRQLKGAFGEKIKTIKDEVVNILSNIEVGIDFPDEEADIVAMDDAVRILVKNVLDPMKNLIETHDMKRIWLDGIKTVIAGRVNVGKSSLLNRFLDEERAIVTPIPGTTRDVIEATITIEGIPLRLMDTAGLRVVKDEVEKKGVQLAGEKIAEADLLLVVIDQSVPLDAYDFELIRQCIGKKAVIILNKIDLPRFVSREEIESRVSGCSVVQVSALSGKGIDDLKRSIVDAITGGDFDPIRSQAVTNLRHKDALTSALSYFKGAVKNMEESAPFEIIALELKCGLDSIEEILGPAASDELLDRIFSQFCLGK